MSQRISIGFQGAENYGAIAKSTGGLVLAWIDRAMLAAINGQETQLGDNTLLCLRGNDKAIKKLKPACKALIRFPLQYIATLQLEILMSRQPNSAVLINPEGLFCEVSPLVGYLLQSVTEEYLSDTAHYKEEVLQALVKLIILEIIRKYTDQLMASSFSSDDVRLVNQFMDLVSEHFLVHKKVSDYADRLCITPNYLNIKVKRISGYTASHHIQQCILQEAIRKARHEGPGLKQLAHYLGYEDATYFSKFFKKLTGQSYSRFRKDLTPLVALAYGV